jgi:hypothetical protein
MKLGKFRPMKAKKRMSNLEMAAKLKAGVSFTVQSEGERNKIYELAKVLVPGGEVTARPRDGGFAIFFLK